MGHYDFDRACDDCGDYVCTYGPSNRMPDKPHYCRECQKKRDTPLEHFIREGERNARS